MKPDDPIEGMLIAQLMAANEAALVMYGRAWSYFNGRVKYQ